jgi:hypothetical protein
MFPELFFLRDKARTIKPTSWNFNTCRILNLHEPLTKSNEAYGSALEAHSATCAHHEADKQGLLQGYWNRLDWTTYQTWRIYHRMGQSPDICRTEEPQGLQGEWLVCGNDNGHLLIDVQLTPFVTKKISVSKGRFEGDKKGAFSGEAYLAKWKAENGED